MMLRFVTATIDPDSGRRVGVFQAAAALRDSTDISASDHIRLRALFDWFNTHLGKPESFSASKRPHAKAQAISWFKNAAHDHLAKVWEIVEILASHGTVVEMIRTARPGYIVYEDDFQIVALPFEDTQT